MIQAGLNLTHAWQLLYTARLQVVDVLPGTLSKIATLESRFGRILGVGTNRQFVNRLSLVRNAQRFGFSLADIAGFLQVREAGGRPCHDVRAAAQRMLIAVDAQIADLMSTRKRMQHTLRNWDRTLQRTPSNQQARLLERLDPPTSGPTVRPASPGSSSAK